MNTEHWRRGEKGAEIGVKSCQLHSPIRWCWWFVAPVLHIIYIHYTLRSLIDYTYMHYNCTESVQIVQFVYMFESTWKNLLHLHFLPAFHWTEKRKRKKLNGINFIRTRNDKQFPRYSEINVKIVCFMCFFPHTAKPKNQNKREQKP